jgi:hypothetical protein
MKKDGQRKALPPGYYQVPNAIYEFGLKPHALVVYQYLCRRGNQGADAYPSYDTIGRDGGMSRRAAIRAVAKLQEVGLVTVEHRRDPYGDAAPNIYRVVNSPVEVEKLLSRQDTQDTDKTSTKQAANPPRDITGGGDTQSLPVVTQSHQGGDTQSPKEEPLKKNPMEEKPLEGSTRGGRTLSFTDFLKGRGNIIDPGIKKVISYFLRTYNRARGEEHPPLQVDTWSGIVDTILVFQYGERSCRPDEIEELEIDDLIPMIDGYFQNTYELDCDYHLPHFATDGIREMLYNRYVRNA